MPGGGQLKCGHWGLGLGAPDLDVLENLTKMIASNCSRIGSLILCLLGLTSVALIVYYVSEVNDVKSFRNIPSCSVGFMSLGTVIELLTDL